MTALPTRNFDQITEDQKVALQVAQPLFNLTPGSDLLALAEANSGLALYLQYLIYRTLKTTRLATCEGPDVDSFGADFLFARYPAVAATGQVLFQRFTAPNQILIPINTIVRTKDNAVSYIVIPDTSNNFYNPELLAYVMNPSILQVSVLVQAVTPGSIGNVATGTITKLGTSMAIGSITNPASFTNGTDQEDDDSYRYRFQLYINTRSRATIAAIENAIINTQTGLSYTINENVDASGDFLPGNILIFYDDGTGFPPNQLTLTLQSNVESVRPAAVSFSLEPANVVVVSVQFATAWRPGFKRDTYVATIALAVENHINSLPVGETLYLTSLYQVIYNSVPGLLDVYGLLINGKEEDLIIEKDEVARFISQVPPDSELVISQITID